MQQTGDVIARSAQHRMRTGACWALVLAAIYSIVCLEVVNDRFNDFPSFEHLLF
jgi:hypothetical protein